MNARQKNEQRFGQWEPMPYGGRRYSYEIGGRHGWSARYVKEVDANERTQSFRQEIYNEIGTLVEIHQKYPVDEGHKPITP